MRSECRRVALACHNAATDSQSCRARDVGHDVVELDIHLQQGLLHMLNVRGGIVQQPFSLAQVGAQCIAAAFGWVGEMSLMGRDGFGLAMHLLLVEWRGWTAQ